MHKNLSVELSSIFSPLCQTLICEYNQEQLMGNENKRLNDCTELFIIRLRNSVIAYATFDVISGTDIQINSLYFRSLIRDVQLTEYWLSRQLRSFFSENIYQNFLQAS